MYNGDQTLTTCLQFFFSNTTTATGIRRVEPNVHANVIKLERRFSIS